MILTRPGPHMLTRHARSGGGFALPDPGTTGATEDGDTPCPPLRSRETDFPREDNRCPP
jgi:hypothetical protein